LNDFHKALPEVDPEDIISTELIEQPLSSNPNSAARRLALQILYEIDITKHAVGDVIDSQSPYADLNERSIQFMRELVLGVMRYCPALDAIISHFAPEFPLKDVAIVDRNVLRIAVYEIAIYQQTPLRVAIDEAVELAKLFGAEGSARFVNGVLGAVVSDEETLTTLLEKHKANDA